MNNKKKPPARTCSPCPKTPKGGEERNLQLIKEVAYFVVILAGAHFFWKFTVLGDESSEAVRFFGLNISAPFNMMVDHVSQSVCALLRLFGEDVSLYSHRVLYPNHQGISVIWGCAGIKQAYIFFCLIAFYKGSWRNKWWYLLAGFAAIDLYNILRIALITVAMENHREWFHFLHGYLFKYLFYLLIFLMWVLWNEHFARKTTIHHSKN